MKKITTDEYIQSVYKVVLHIEQNYSYDLTLDELSKVAGFSKYHFHRIFKSIIGENLSDYIRRTRLSNVTLKFLTDKNVTQIAQESGYETSASFTKAFKKYFGVTPKVFSKNIKTKKGLVMLEPKIVELKDVEVLYVRKEGEYSKSAGEAWEVLMGFTYKNKIKHKKNLMGKDAMMFGIGHDNPNVTDASKLRFDACVSYDDKSVEPQGEVLVKTIDGGKYASFLHKGAYENLKTTYDSIGDWIVESDVKLRDVPMFEKYLNRDPRRTKVENLRTEIYVPIGE